MDWLISNFQGIFFIVGLVAALTGFGWFFNHDIYDKPAKIFKLLFLFGAFLFIMCIIVGNTFLKTETQLKFPTSEVMTGTVIDEKGQSSTYYKWKSYILPNTIAPYLMSSDTITMIKSPNPWDKKVSYRFIISNEKLVKPKPAPIDTTSTNIKLK